MPQEQHDDLVRRTVAEVPSEHRERFAQKLEYANEPSLRRRVKELLDHTRPAIPDLIPDRSSFANTVVNTRNYYVHYDPGLRDAAAQGVDLYWLTQKVDFVLLACLLLEMGFSADRCAYLFRRNQRCQFLANPSQGLGIRVAGG